MELCIVHMEDGEIGDKAWNYALCDGEIGDDVCGT